MATATLIPIEQYLKTSYCPDVEFIDGELREKPVVQSVHSQWVHSQLQALLSAWFVQHDDAWKIQVGVEARTRVAEARVRLPDVVVLKAGPQPQTLVDPPLIVIEILSPDDSYTETERRARDYQSMGIENIWLIDPDTRTARVCRGESWTEIARFTVADSPIYLDVKTLFARLDKQFG
jgi:Uma2 family endonuclease